MQEPATFPTEEEFNLQPSNFEHPRLHRIFGTDVSGVPKPRSTAGLSPLPITNKARPIPSACTDFEASSQPSSPRTPSPSTPSPTHSPATHCSQRCSITTNNTAEITAKATAGATVTARPIRSTRQQCSHTTSGYRNHQGETIIKQQAPYCCNSRQAQRQASSRDVQA